MKREFPKSPLFIALAATILGGTAHAADDTKEGFIDGSTLNLHLRNFYYNHDSRTSDGDDRQWAQGILATFESGYTPGVVGFGLDVHGMMGIKLDGDGEGGGSTILPEGEPGTFSTGGATLKARAFDTEFKAGDLFLSNPVIAGGATRMLPQTFRGWSLTNHSIDGLMLEGGEASFTKLYNQSGHQRISTYYGSLDDNREPKHLTWLGGAWSGTPNLTSNLYASQLQNVWTQYYYDLDYTWALNDLVSINPGLHYYHTQDTGSALLGDINNNTYSLHVNVGVGHHTFTVAMQKVNGDTPFDYIYQGDSIFLDNSMQYSDFNGPGERSWKVAYTYDFAGLGVPGLTSSIAYVRGTLDLGDASSTGGYTSWYHPEEGNVSHWERDIDVKYTVQGGPAKDLSVRLRYSTNRGSGGYSVVDNDVDEARVIVDYPINVF